MRKEKTMIPDIDEMEERCWEDFEEMCHDKDLEEILQALFGKAYNWDAERMHGDPVEAVKLYLKK